MASTAGYYGLRPVGALGDAPYNGGTIREYKMAVNSATGIFTGDLVNVISGTTVAAAAATPTTTLGTNNPVGICVGVRYTEPTLKYSIWSSYLPANAITNGYTNVFIRVVDNPLALFMVMADGAVAATNIGYNAPLGNFGAGSTTTGLSGVNLTSASIAKTATLAVRIVDLVNEQSVFGGGLDAPGDAYTQCIVMFNWGVHLLGQGTGNANQ